MNFDILYTFVLATLALSISPGPDNIYVLMQSIVNGKKYGLATVAGLMSGCLVHTTLVAFGVSVIIQKSEMLFFAIKLMGALYLFFLAYKVWRSKGSIQLSEDSVEKKSVGQLFRQGFIMNVLNPKVSIFFLAFFPGFLFSKELSSVTQFYVLGFLFIVVSFIVFGGIAIMAGFISDYVKSNSKVGVFLKWMQIIVFVGIGIFILFSRK
ncbi:Threonine/homoserine/homoserine lactone efflux protein [Aquimarina amphilecti]|uniref:Threonine/homoserine/homoserine lactone efflux protein n=1 Tax=Aquimarina amphilecti TaxID=1038014 RepID=A0A1H7PN79_AQUAM|nr:LysE family translocator [Aquimarina amphilecti]SEL36705.1 Threonine/homoserine/homoserine lactone efflux protein [Aquimarina amphilecti]